MVGISISFSKQRKDLTKQEQDSEELILTLYLHLASRIHGGTMWVLRA